MEHSYLIIVLGPIGNEAQTLQHPIDRMSIHKALLTTSLVGRESKNPTSRTLIA